MWLLSNLKRPGGKRLSRGRSPARVRIIDPRHPSGSGSSAGFPITALSTISGESLAFDVSVPADANNDDVYGAYVDGADVVDAHESVDGSSQ